MSELKMVSPAVKNIPWQEKPEGLTGAPVWRYTENPIIDRNPVEGVARIFNSAVVPYEGASILGEVRTESTGNSSRSRFHSRTKTATILCRFMHTTRAW
jgi:beta-1,4-mannooligosaccharide/beta-1,4-mannosyl-N-acetylglucosamine phosphorylase